MSGVMIIALAGCAPDSQSGKPGTSAASGLLKVVVSIPPQAYIVERVGGEHVETTVLVGPGQSPHSYEPTPKQMAALAQSRVYFTIGVQFETQLVEKVRAIFKNLEIADVRDGMPLRAMAEDGCVHDHEDESGGDDGHDHVHGHAEAAGGKDPHVWLSPALLAIETKNVLKHFETIDPSHAETYRRNADSLLADLKTLDDDLRSRLAPYRGREFFVYHPAFGYFGDAYGLKQVAVEAEGKEPGPRHVAAIIARAKASGVRLIFVQKQFSSASAKAIADAIGGTVIPLDPLERNCLENLRFIADQIAQEMQGGGPAASQAATSQAA